MPVAASITAAAILDALAFARISHVAMVPDTAQLTVLDALERRGGPPVIRCAAEDDVFGVCAGLWMAGHRPLALVQQLGLFAGANALRGLVHDQGVALAVLAALYGRDVGLPVAADPASAVRLCPPLLDALELDWTLVEGPSDARGIGPLLAAALDEGRARVVLLGAPTA